MEKKNIILPVILVWKITVNVLVYIHPCIYPFKQITK